MGSFMFLQEVLVEEITAELALSFLQSPDCLLDLERLIDNWALLVHLGL